MSTVGLIGDLPSQGSDKQHACGQTKLSRNESIPQGCFSCERHVGHTRNAVFKQAQERADCRG